MTRNSLTIFIKKNLSNDSICEAYFKKAVLGVLCNIDVWYDFFQLSDEMKLKLTKSLCLQLNHQNLEDLKKQETASNGHKQS